MKYILFIFVSVFIAVSCIDDKTNLDYKEINEYQNWKIEGVDASYSLFPGESVTLTPKVRLSIDSLNPDVSYSCCWMEKRCLLTLLIRLQQMCTENTN